MKKMLAVIILLLAFMPALAMAVSVSLSWDMPYPLTYNDGTPCDDNELGGYVIYWGQQPRTYLNFQKVPSPGYWVNIPGTVSSLPTGTFYFAVTAVCSGATNSHGVVNCVAGQESDYSQEISMFLSAGPPLPPTNLRGVVNGVTIS